ncbi:hypothetical protein [Aliamphritea spongicola]|nr:hypothetical protein [Aliamphritea spongicola]
MANQSRTPRAAAPKGASRVQPNQKRDGKVARGAEQHRLKVKDKSRSYLRHHGDVARSLLIRCYARR